jgi:hypothetical protein
VNDCLLRFFFRWSATDSSALGVDRSSIVVFVDAIIIDREAGFFFPEAGLLAKGTRERAPRPRRKYSSRSAISPYVQRQVRSFFRF